MDTFMNSFVAEASCGYSNTSSGGAEQNQSRFCTETNAYVEPVILASSSWPTWKTWLLTAFILAFFSTYSITCYQYNIVGTQNMNKKVLKTPAAPYWIPGLGHLPYMAWDLSSCLESLFKSLGTDVPFILKAGPVPFTVLANPEHIQAVFRNSRWLSAKASTVFALRFLLVVPSRIIPFYQDDDSGMAATPRKGSNTQQEDRIHFLQAHNAQKFLSSRHLDSLLQRFVVVLNQNFDKLAIKDEWSNRADLFQFLQHIVASSAIETLMGSKILEMSPNLVDDFWTFESHAPKFFRFYPWWLARKGHQARERLVEAVQKWHTYAHSHADHTKTTDHDPDWEPVFGSKLVKMRQTYELRCSKMDADVRAREDVGLMFAINANVVPAIFWYIFESLRSPHLHNRLMVEVKKSYAPNTGVLDPAQLFEQPLLQSAYAEVLRLRVAILTTRIGEYKQVKFGGYTLPQYQHIMIYSRASALNEKEWIRAGRRSEKSLDQFDADRFLVRSDTVAIEDRSSMDSETTTVSSGSTPSPRFSMDGLAGLWLPYGGGDRMCPGRHFAKKELLLTYAILFERFDLELTSDDASRVKPNMFFAPYGTLPPNQHVPFRIRRRKLARHRF